MKKIFLVFIMSILTFLTIYVYAFPQEYQDLYISPADDNVCIDMFSAGICYGAQLPNPCPLPPAGYQLRDPGINSGSLCRGACGADCHPSACRPHPDLVLTVGDLTTGVTTCTYKVVACGSHPGCVAHDNCYDGCAGRTFEGLCKRNCDLQCKLDYNDADCIAWANGNGPQPNVIKFVDLKQVNP